MQVRLFGELEAVAGARQCGLAPATQGLLALPIAGRDSRSAPTG